MDAEKEINQLRLELLIIGLGYQADREALIKGLLQVAAINGFPLLDGLPFGEWIEKQRQEALIQILMKVETTDPALAAYVQSIVNKSNPKNDPLAGL
jgi:hypothetical protein